MVTSAARRRVGLCALVGCLSVSAIAAQPGWAKTLSGNGSSSSGDPTPVPNAGEAPTPYIVPPAAPAASAASATTTTPDSATSEPDVAPDDVAVGTELRQDDRPEPTPTTASVPDQSPIGPLTPRSAALAGPPASPSALALRSTKPGPASLPTSSASPAGPTTLGIASTTSATSDATPTVGRDPATTTPAPVAKQCPLLPEASAASSASSASSAWIAGGEPGIRAGTVQGSAPLPGFVRNRGRDVVLTVFVTRLGTAEVLGVYRGLLRSTGSFRATATCVRDGVDALRQGEVEAHLVLTEDGETVTSQPVSLNVLAGPAIPPPT